MNNIEKIKQIITSRKKKTNCFAFFNEIDEWLNRKKANAHLINNCVFIFLQANGFYKFYYYVNNFHEIKYAKELLENYQTDQSISLEFTTKNDKDLEELTKEINKIGFEFYAKLARLLAGTNKLEEEVKKEEYLYELATKENKEELLRIMHNEFDFIIDDIPTKEELDKLITNKCVIIKRIDKKIVFIQIYEHTKNTLYSRMTWIEKKYRKPKYTINFYKALDEYIKQLNLKNGKNLRCYYWVNTNIKNYKISLKQGALLDNITCNTFIYKSDRNQ